MRRRGVDTSILHGLDERRRSTDIHIVVAEGMGTLSPTRDLAAKCITASKLPSLKTDVSRALSRISAVKAPLSGLLVTCGQVVVGLDFKAVLTQNCGGHTANVPCAADYQYPSHHAF